MTTYEREIYRIINESRDHLTAEQVFGKVRETHPGVALATIYNNLNRLDEAGLIRRLSIKGLPDRYDRTERHDHLVCRRCGRIADLAFADMTDALRRTLGEDFLYYDLKVFCLCPDCRKRRHLHEEDSAGEGR